MKNDSQRQFVSVRREEEIAELAEAVADEYFPAARIEPAEILKAKEREGVLNLRYDAEAIVSYLFAVGDGFALQALSDPKRDNSAALAAGTASARYLLVAE